MKIRHTIWGGLILALAACSGGGGGGGGGGAAQAPQADAPSFNNATGTTTFPTTATVASYSQDLTAGSTGHKGLSNAQTQISVNFDTGTIRISVNQPTDGGTNVLFDQTFGPANFVGAADGGALFQHAGGALLIYDPATGPVDLDYTAFGVWATNRFGPLFGSVATGFTTAFAGVPTSGTARYTGVTFGAGIEAGTGYGVAGLVTLDANFGTGAISGGFHDMARVDVNGNITAFQDISVSASIAAGGNSYSGTVSSTRPGFSSGDVSGAFFGPNAEETGGTWRLKADSGDDAYVGAYGATQ